MNTAVDTKYNKLATYLIVGILVLLPFHALLTTWAGSNFGHLDVFRIWKELLFLLLDAYAAIRVWRNRSLAAALLDSTIVRLILLYFVLFLIVGCGALALGRVNATALAYSWITNLRLVWVFLIVWVCAYKNDFIHRNWQYIVLIPATLVIGFGLLQQFVLPVDVLRHVGYGPATIPAVQTVDQKLAYQRIQSTLRGANPLGAYLLVVIVALIVGMRQQKYRLQMSILFGCAVALMFFTYSRSAWVGVVIAVAVLLWRRNTSDVLKKWLLVGLVGLACIGSLAVWGLRDNNFVQNTLFHSDETSQSAQSSNTSRVDKLKAGFSDLIDEPFGRGPGSAGPASYRNAYPPRIAENYFIQLGQEVGLIGMGLFIAICSFVGIELWRRKQDPLAELLFASLIGITVVNFVSHAWTDDTLAILWWSLAGATMAVPAIMTTSKKKTSTAHGKIANKTSKRTH